MKRIALTILLPLAIAQGAWASEPDEATVRRVHASILTLDSHADIIAPNNPKRLYLPDGTTQTDLDKLIAGGIDVITYCITSFPGPDDQAGIAAARKEADYKQDWIRQLLAAHPDKMGLALSSGDIVRLHREGRIAVLMSFQNARSIGSDIAQIDRLYDDGVRVFSFNHAGHNAFSDSSRPWQEPIHRHHGLSELGRQAVQRLNTLGILIDVSQLSKESVLQTVSLSHVPVVATHSAARHLFEHIRNLSDEELDAIRAKGGVVQVVPFGQYLKAENPETRAALDALGAKYGLIATAEEPYAGDKFYSMPKAQQDLIMAEAAKIPVFPPTLKDYVDHIDFIANRIGWTHVGIGTDFNQGGGVTGFNSEAEAMNVTRELLRRGYTQRQIAGVWGGNFLRVLRTAERYSSVGRGKVNPAAR